MKSVTVYSKSGGHILIKVIQRKNGEYILEGDNRTLECTDIDVRDDKNKKVFFA